MRKSKSGFTIVELLVAIVIISILATITIVTYRGVQDRAKATQTNSAVEQWLKALQVYKIRNTTFPTAVGCLGIGYGWGMNNTVAQGGATAQCRQDAGVSLTQNTTLNNLLAKYITGNPLPSMVTASNTATSWFRGAYYYTSGADSYLGFSLPAASTCPATIGGTITVTTNNTTTNGNKQCEYKIGVTAGF